MPFYFQGWLFFLFNIGAFFTPSWISIVTHWKLRQNQNSTDNATVYESLVTCMSIVLQDILCSRRNSIVSAEYEGSQAGVILGIFFININGRFTNICADWIYFRPVGWLYNERSLMVLCLKCQGQEQRKINGRCKTNSDSWEKTKLISVLVRSNHMKFWLRNTLRFIRGLATRSSEAC